MNMLHRLFSIFFVFEVILCQLIQCSVTLIYLFIYNDNSQTDLLLIVILNTAYKVVAVLTFNLRIQSVGHFY